MNMFFRHFFFFLFSVKTQHQPTLPTQPQKNRLVLLLVVNLKPHKNFPRLIRPLKELALLPLWPVATHPSRFPASHRLQGLVGIDTERPPKHLQLVPSREQLKKSWSTGFGIRQRHHGREGVVEV